MSVRIAQPNELSVRQRLCLFHGTGVGAEEALSMQQDSITFEVLISNGVNATNLTVAQLKPMALKRMGVQDASQLRRLGFDALHLTDAAFCTEANAAYGADSVVDAFLTSPSDAVALAGSEAMHILNISTDKLLESCAGAPTEALSVLQQITDADPLKGIPASVLLDAGLRAPALAKLGMNFGKLMSQTAATPDQALKLGFRL